MTRYITPSEEQRLMELEDRLFPEEEVSEERETKFSFKDEIQVKTDNEKKLILKMAIQQFRSDLRFYFNILRKTKWGVEEVNRVGFWSPRIDTLAEMLSDIFGGTVMSWKDEYWGCLWKEGEDSFELASPHFFENAKDRECFWDMQERWENGFEAFVELIENRIQKYGFEKSDEI